MIISELSFSFLRRCDGWVMNIKIAFAEFFLMIISASIFLAIDNEQHTNPIRPYNTHTYLGSPKHVFGCILSLRFPLHGNTNDFCSKNHSWVAAASQPTRTLLIASARLYTKFLCLQLYSLHHCLRGGKGKPRKAAKAAASRPINAIYAQGFPSF